MTTAEFERRCAAARSYANGPGLRLWMPALAGVAMMLASMWPGEGGFSATLGIAGIVLFMGFTIASGVVSLHRGGRAAAEFGLLCAGCGSSLIGGPNAERTGDVRRGGCCSLCHAPVLDDHAGAREAAVRQAALARALPHPSAFARDDFDRRYAECRRRLGRLQRIILPLLLAVPAVVLGAMFLPLDGAVRLRVLQAGALFFAGVVPWQLLWMRSVALKLGIRCPACRKIPLNSADISVTRTGVCPYCSALMILPSPSPDGWPARESVIRATVDTSTYAQ